MRGATPRKFSRSHVGRSSTAAIFHVVFGALLTLLLAPATARAANRELEDIYARYQTDQAALSPDGQHLAYSVYSGKYLNLCIVGVDQPSAKATVFLGSDVTEGLWRTTTRSPARLTGLRWVSADKLVYAVEIPAPAPANRREEIRIVSANGSGDRMLVNRDSLSEASAQQISDGAMKKFNEGTKSTADIDMHTIIVPRTPRLLNAYDPAFPDCIFVEALGGMVASSEVFRVDLTTGAFKPITWESALGRVLYDQQGNPRILEPNFRRGQPLFDRPYRLRNAAGVRLREMDDYFGTIETEEFRITPTNVYEPHSYPIAFDRDPNVLFVLSNVGRDSLGLYALDLQTKVRTPVLLSADDNLDVAEPEAALNENLFVFDRQRQVVGLRYLDPRPRTSWLDPELAKVQTYLDQAFPGRSPLVINFDDARRRFLVLVDGPATPGRYFVLTNEPGAPRLTEFVRVAPQLSAEATHPTYPFTFDTPAGVHLNGWLTVPKVSRTTPAPLVIWCGDIPGRLRWPGFNRDAQALAEMGFAVAQVYYRGSAGFGLRHRNAARTNPDRVPLEDIRATIAWLGPRFPVSRRRVALIGEGFGGYLAVRALQLYPREFRCAVTIEGPSDPASWAEDNRPAMLNGTGAKRREFFQADLRPLSLLPEAAKISRAVFIITNGSPLAPTQVTQATDLRRALEKAGHEPEFLDLNNRASDAPPETRANVFARIGAFLNTHLYDYDTQIGETEVIE
jgi:dienelactone hydrolase